MATSRLYSPPDALITSTRGGTYSATYRVDNDGTTIKAGLQAIILGQSSGPDMIPAYGTSFSLSIVGTVVQDLGSFLLDIRARPVGTALPEPGVKLDQWDIDVTWRAPDQGEYPAEAGIGALSRSPRYWVEFDSRPKQVVQAKNIQALRVDSPNDSGDRLAERGANTNGRIEDGAGTPVGDLFVEGVAPVLVVQRNVASFATAVSQNLTYENTKNSDVWNGIPIGQARFLRTETGQQLYDGTSGDVYYEQQTRVEFLSSPQYLKVPNIGYDRVVKPASGDDWYVEHVRDADGLPQSDPAVLNYDGVQSFAAGQFVIDYDYLTPAAYAGIA